MGGRVMFSQEFEPVFGREKGVIWAADVEPHQFARTIEQIGDVEGLVGIKLGFGVRLGEIWHPIIGRGVHENKDGLNPREAVEFYVQQMRVEQ